MGVLRRKALPRPVVSIGNLTLGGGGKTPLVLWLARAALEHGKKPAILTRGYGREGKHTLIVEPGTDWREAGDEPTLISRALPEVPIAVFRDRSRGGWEVLHRGDVDLFILDDGFSHHALKKDLEIVVVDDRRRFGNGRVFPGGILREPLKRLKEADVVVMTKAKSVDPSFREQVRKTSGAPVFWADFRPGPLVRVDGGEKPESHPERPFLGFCGIADPEGFRLSLKRAGIEVLELLAFPDHHPYTFSDVALIRNHAARLGAKALVTTEKDGVRWPGGNEGLPCFALTIEIVFLEGEDELKNTFFRFFQNKEREAL